MEKTIKTYVQKIYKNVIVDDIFVSEVEDRDPLEIKTNGSMIGFRFFDKEFIKDGNKTYISEELNYSPWYFFGTRLSEADIKLVYGNTKGGKIILKRMKEDGYKYVCHTDLDTFLPMEQGDTTINEYIFKKTKRRELKNEI